MAETKFAIPETLDAVLEKIRTKYDQVSFHPMEIDGAPFEILEVDNMTKHLDKLMASPLLKNPIKELPLWASVWPGTFVLETYLRKKVACAGKTMLELGGGTGTLALLASRLGFSGIIASDIEEMALYFTKANILRNNLSDKVSVMYLDVAAPGKNPEITEPVDVIAASEILYLDELHGPILNFLSRHLAPGGQAVFCTDMARRKPHFAKKAAKSFRVTEMYLPGSFTDADGDRHKRLYSLLILEK